jgi:MerR family mercuric resistance operon transcriptional regulator
MPAITASRAEMLPIGALSKRSGVNIETIRYYERVKMLAPPPRTASGRRVYNSTDLRILVFIRRSRELGFSLDEIRALLRLGGPEKASCREVREIAAHHLEDIRARLVDLRSSNACWLKQWPDVRAGRHQIAPCWTFSILNVRDRDVCRLRVLAVL